MNNWSHASAEKNFSEFPCLKLMESDSQRDEGVWLISSHMLRGKVVCVSQGRGVKDAVGDSIKYTWYLLHVLISELRVPASTYTAQTKQNYIHVAIGTDDSEITNRFIKYGMAKTLKPCNPI